MLRRTNHATSEPATFGRTALLSIPVHMIQTLLLGLLISINLILSGGSG